MNTQSELSPLGTTGGTTERATRPACRREQLLDGCTRRFVSLHRATFGN
jgi:hypothetical protein